MNSTEYITGTKKQFLYYKSIAEKTFDTLTDEQLFWQYNDTSNSIAIIVKHLWGNMMSRWTNFLTEDGEKTWRKRDAEFENDIKSREEVLQKWNEGWQCLFNALDSVNDTNFDQPIYIRNVEHSIQDAVNRQLAHYPYHIGQIIFIGKMIQDDKWQSLSIPKRESATYNKKRFAQPKHKAHYTDDLMYDPHKS